MFKNKIFLGIWGEILCSSLAMAETIQLKSGNDIHGKIVEETEKYIRVDVGIDTPLTFYRDEIERVLSAENPVPVNIKNHKGEQHFLWKATSGQATVYLFGSIHLGRADMYPLSQVIEDAFKKSSTLVVEVKLEDMDPMTIQQTMMQKGSYPNDEYLQDQISDSTFAALQRRLVQFGLPLEQISHFKPWLMAMTLSVLQIKMLGFDENYGVDHYFSQTAA